MERIIKIDILFKINRRHLPIGVPISLNIEYFFWSIKNQKLNVSVENSGWQMVKWKYEKVVRIIKSDQRIQKSCRLGRFIRWWHHCTIFLQICHEPKSNCEWWALLRDDIQISPQNSRAWLERHVAINSSKEFKNCSEFYVFFNLSIVFKNQPNNNPIKSHKTLTPVKAWY